MNPLWSRIKAIAVTVLVFALSGALLLGAIVALRAAPLPANLVAPLGAFSANSVLTGLVELELFYALASAYLVAAALVVLAATVYGDRMLEIFADVLLMAMAAATGLGAGLWLILRLMDMPVSLPLSVLERAWIPAAIVFLVSLVAPQRARGNRLVQTLVSLVLLLGGVATIVFLP